MERIILWCLSTEPIEAKHFQYLASLANCLAWKLLKAIFILIKLPVYWQQVWFICAQTPSTSGVFQVPHIEFWKQLEELWTWGMDVTCLSQARCGWALSQLSSTARSWHYPSYPACHSRTGFSIGHNKVFDIKSGCRRFWISSRESQFLGDEMFSKVHRGVLGAVFRPPSVCAHLPQDQWVICIALISPPWTISVVECLQNPNRTPRSKLGGY